jgi:hypothetical protein
MPSPLRLRVPQYCRGGMKPFPELAIERVADRMAAFVPEEPYGVTPIRFFCWARRRVAPSAENMAMAGAVWSSFGGSKARLLVLPAIAIAGCAAWLLLPGPSGAQNPDTQNPPAQNAASLNPPGPPTETAPLTPEQPAAPTLAAAPTDVALVEAPPSPLDGLKISSQSWRRGGLGSKALVTFTLRNGNEYAVKDIEIACAFTRRDGRHLTDRKRLISDVVEMKSRKIFAKMHVGFVNVNADKARCSLVTASRV